MPEQGQRIALHRTTSVPGAEVLAAYGNADCWHVFHERYAICACRTAAAAWRYRGKSYFLQDGSVGFMQPGEVHRNTSVHKPSDFKVLFIDPEVFGAGMDELGHRGEPRFRIAQSEDRTLFDSIYRVCERLEHAAPGFEQESAYVECLALLALQIERPPAPEKRSVSKAALRRARSYLLERYDQSVRLDELSRFAGLSRFHLLRAFRQEFGSPPHAFQVAVRIERARALLRRGATALEAGLAVGFADQSHFSRHFKSVYRVTPAEYARA